MTIIHFTNEGEKPITDAEEAPEALADIAELLVRLDRPHAQTRDRKNRLIRSWTGNKGNGWG